MIDKGLYIKNQSLLYSLQCNPRTYFGELPFGKLLCWLVVCRPSGGVGVLGSSGDVWGLAVCVLGVWDRGWSGVQFNSTAYRHTLLDCY